MLMACLLNVRFCRGIWPEIDEEISGNAAKGSLREAGKLAKQNAQNAGKDVLTRLRWLGSP
jgi:hypothetical protein